VSKLRIHGVAHHIELVVFFDIHGTLYDVVQSGVQLEYVIRGGGGTGVTHLDHTVLIFKN